MRREPMPAGLLTCTVFALWALALAIAAWLGLGSRLPQAADSSQPPPLPELPVLSTERLGELSQYPQVASRPLFNEGRRPQPYYIGGSPEQQTGSVRLSGVLITDQLRMATLSGEGGLSLRLQLGGPAVQGWQLLELSERQATVLGPSGSQVLPLATYDGGTVAADGSTAAASNSAPAAAAGQAPPPRPSAIPPPPATGSPPDPVAAAAPTGNEPSAAQMQAIRARIQARRAQMQQNNNGQPTGQNR